VKSLALWSVDHRRLVLVLWVALVVGVYGTSTVIGSRSSNNFSLPNTGSQQATDLLKQSYPAQAGDSDQIVLRARRGKLTSPRCARPSSRCSTALPGCRTSPA
jgi:RND superfamily putative drug exporter